MTVLIIEETLSARVVIIRNLIALIADQLLAGTNVYHFLLFQFFLSLFLHTLNGFPSDAVSHGLAATTEDWERVQPGIVSENLLQVISGVDIVNALEWLAFLLQILDCGLVFPRQLDMELQEGGYKEADHGDYYEGQEDDDVVAEVVVVFCDELVLEAPLDHLVEIERHEDARSVDDQEHIHQKEQKLLAIPETYAVIYPWTMMVHIEDTSVAGGAVVAPLGLEDIAHEAITSTLVLVVAQVESPEHWHLPRIGRHGLKERPKHHGEEDVVKY